MTSGHGIVVVTRVVAMTPAAAVAAGRQAGSGSIAGRLALVAVAVLAVAAFAVLHARARSRRRRPPSHARRRYDPSDWRTLPPPYWPEGHRDEPAGREQRYRPDRRYGYPPGYEPYPLYDPSRSPWVTHDDAPHDSRPLSGTGRTGPAALERPALCA
jgi:hypothetical protein